MKEIMISNKLLLNLLACFIICYIAAFFFYSNNLFEAVNLYDITEEHGWLCGNDTTYQFLQSGYIFSGLTFFMLFWMKLFFQRVKTNDA